MTSAAQNHLLLDALREKAEAHPELQALIYNVQHGMHGCGEGLLAPKAPLPQASLRSLGLILVGEMLEAGRVPFPRTLIGSLNLCLLSFLTPSLSQRMAMQAQMRKFQSSLRAGEFSSRESASHHVPAGGGGVTTGPQSPRAPGLSLGLQALWDPYV